MVEMGDVIGAVVGSAMIFVPFLVSFVIFWRNEVRRDRFHHHELMAQSAGKMDPFDPSWLRRICEREKLDYDLVLALMESPKCRAKPRSGWRGVADREIEEMKSTARVEYLSNDDGKTCVWCHYHIGQNQVSSDEFRNVWTGYPVLTIRGKRVSADCMRDWLNDHKDGRWTKSL